MLTRGGSTPELGNEPPLDVAGVNAEIIDRRDVSLRWLGASILVGITGGLLIGASVFIAFRGQTTIVQEPQRARVTDYTSNEDTSSKTMAKGDRLLRQAGTSYDRREGVKLPVTIKVGNREIIKVRQFIRISTTLSPTAGLYATNIPPFNPMKLMNEGDEPQAAVAEPAPEIADADVSFARTSLAGVVFADGQQILSDSDALAQLEAESKLLQRGQHAGLAISPQLLAARPLPSIDEIRNVGGQGKVIGDGLFSGIEVRVIPENITNIVKDQAAQGELEDQVFTLKKGETLQSFLASQGANTEQIKAIVATLAKNTNVANLGEGQKVLVLVGKETTFGPADRLLRVSIMNDKTITAIAALSDRGEYVPVQPDQPATAPDNRKPAGMIAKAQPPKADEEDDEEDDKNEKLGTARIYDSLYETAAKNNMPAGMVSELVRQFGSDVDFQRRVSPNDSIDVLYSVGDDASDKPEMIYASITAEGDTRKLYRFQGNDGIEYLDGGGQSLKRFLLRKPITDARMTSPFGYRRHPVLGYAKLHTGVDWANKIGTPILAAGNGTIVYASWKSGYGNHIEIQHANGYLTTYSHQSRFAGGSVVGAKVRQGQIIGYVGNTGLATGPHLHYEVKVNGNFVDPMKIRLPHDRELDGPTLAEFTRQRNEIDSLLQKAGASMALAQGSAN